MRSVHFFGPVVRSVFAFNCLALAVAGYNLMLLYSSVRLLTLRGAWCWSVAAVAAIMVAMAADAMSPEISPAWRSTAHYVSATMLLAPAVAVLGARRPGAAAWPWFVVVPLIVVLLWPGLSQLMNIRGRQAVEIGWPAISGVFLVSVMSFGNYLGTANTLAATLAAAAVMCSLLPVTGWVSEVSALPMLTPVLVALASQLVLRRIRLLNSCTAKSAQQSADRMWLLFRDSYGIVWAARVADRVNQFAERERWTVRLTLDGFRAKADSLVRASGADRDQPGDSPRMVSEKLLHEQCLLRPIEVLCWVLKRFARPEWLERQLGSYYPQTPNA